MTRNTARRATVACLLAGTVLATATTGAIAQAQPGDNIVRNIVCGEFYEVQPGDTLREIAVDAYTTGDYEAIFSANRDILSTPSLLLVGQRLFIPCLDGTGPQTRQEAEAQIVQDQQELLQPPELSAEALALPDPVPLPPEEETIAAAEDEDPDAGETALDALARLSDNGGDGPAGAVTGLQPAAGGGVSGGGIAPGDLGVSGVQPPPSGGGAEPSGPAVAGLQPAPGAASEGDDGAADADAGQAPSGPGVAGLQPAPGAAGGSTGGGTPAAGGGDDGAVAGLQPAPGSSGRSGAGFQPSPGGGGAVQPAPGGAAGVQPAPGGGGAVQPPQGASGAGAVAGVQPSSGGQVETQSGSAVAGVQPAAGASGGGQPAPRTPRATGDDALALLQPAPGPSGVQPAPGPSGVQPAPGPSAGQAAAGGGGGVAGIQPSSGGGARATAQPGSTAALIGPGPGASSGARVDPLGRPATGPGQPPAGASGGAADSGPLVARLAPTAAPRPQQQPTPNRPAGRAPTERGVASPEQRPLPDVPAVDPDLEAGQSAGTIRLLTGAYPPFTGDTLPQKGMLSDVVVRALDTAAPGRAHRIAFINDWDAHLAILLPDGVFDLGYPWFRPDCSDLASLTPDLRSRCTDYTWSQPLHEVVIGYFVASGSPFTGIESHAALSGLAICRPAGFDTFDLAQNGLAPPAVTLVRPDTAADCVEALAAGEVDVVSLSVTQMEGEIAAAGVFGQVAELPALADILTLHVLSPRTNPMGRTYITLINRGLREMRDSGEWFDVVARHLAEYTEGVR